MVKILIVDDDTAIVRLLSVRLSKQGYDISTAYNGREALEAVSADPPDIILLDVDMPEMDGVEVCRRLKADEQLQHIQIIMVTGNVRDEDMVAGLDAGADDYVVKPFNGEILAARLRSAARVKNAHDAVVHINEQLRREIVERKLLERELAHAQKMEAVGHMASGIAHEINTPIQYVGNNTQFLKDGFAEINRLPDAVEKMLQAVKENTVTDKLIAEVENTIKASEIEYLRDEIPKSIDQSLEGIGRVASIVRAMREFSHPDGRKKEPMDLNHAIENTLIVSRNEWKYVAEVVTDFNPELPPVLCLPGDLNQAVLNVVVNAAQAIAEVVGRDGSGGKGTITICTRRVGDTAEIRIEDTGPGIPENIRSKVFDPFFTTKEVGRGTGQGLAITYSVVTKKHGGTITFETEPGRGTTFIIRLPIEEQAACSLA